MCCPESIWAQSESPSDFKRGGDSTPAPRICDIAKRHSTGAHPPAVCDSYLYFGVAR
jgi:hypothetical protein